MRTGTFWVALTAGCTWVSTDELADYRDQDGDGEASTAFDGKDCDDDNADVILFLQYPDDDGDGFGAANRPKADACALVSGYLADGTDCDDTHANVNPGSIWYTDADRDGWGDATTADGPHCAPTSADQVLVSGDCDDDDATLTPDTPLFRDDDGDGLGVGAAVPIRLCSQVGGLARTNDDCDDDDDAVGATHPEYRDEDGDGWGTAEEQESAGCDSTPGWTAVPGDCDDADDTVGDYFPDTFEDDDEDGLPDRDAPFEPNHPGCAGVPLTPGAWDCDDDDPTVEGPRTFWVDLDDDGLGDPAVSDAYCLPQAGYVENGDDCDDGRADVGRNLPQWEDLDHDGFGDPGRAVTDEGCALAPGNVADDTDCDDSDEDTRPGVPDPPRDGWDQDCDGTDLGADAGADLPAFTLARCATPTLDEADPATLQAKLDAAADCTVLRLAEGLYAPAALGAVPTSGRALALVAAPNAHVVFEPSAVADRAFVVEDAEELILEGITFSGLAAVVLLRDDPVLQVSGVTVEGGALLEQEPSAGIPPFLGVYGSSFVGTDELFVAPALRSPRLLPVYGFALVASEVQLAASSFPIVGVQVLDDGSGDTPVARIDDLVLRRSTALDRLIALQATDGLVTLDRVSIHDSIARTAIGAVGATVQVSRTEVSDNLFFGSGSTALALNLSDGAVTVSDLRVEHNGLDDQVATDVTYVTIDADTVAIDGASLLDNAAPTGDSLLMNLSAAQPSTYENVAAWAVSGSVLTVDGAFAIERSTFVAYQNAVARALPGSTVLVSASLLDTTDEVAMGPATWELTDVLVSPRATDPCGLPGVTCTNVVSADPGFLRASPYVLPMLGDLRLVDCSGNPDPFCQAAPQPFWGALPVGSEGSTDDDGDGLYDAWELEFFPSVATTDSASDPDLDGLTNGRELTVTRTLPTARDSDGDGVPDRDPATSTLDNCPLLPNPLQLPSDCP